MFYKNCYFLGFLFILTSTFFIGGCQDRVHESWVEKPAPPVYDDPIIFARINGSIKDDPLLENTEINIEVNDGIVLLTGMANSQDQADQAVMHSWRVDGVKNVDSQINIKKK